MLSLLIYSFSKAGPPSYALDPQFLHWLLLLVQPWPRAPILLTGLLPFPVVPNSFLSNIFWILGLPIPGPGFPVTDHLGIDLLPAGSKLVSATQFLLRTSLILTFCPSYFHLQVDATLHLLGRKTSSARSPAAFPSRCHKWPFLPP